MSGATRVVGHSLPRLDAPGKVQSIHHGKGQGKNALVFDAADFETALSFIRYVELEPGASIGNHRHGENDKVFVILSGSGALTRYKRSNN